MRILITGINGFVGRHLTALLLPRGDEIHGTAHHSLNDRTILPGLDQARIQVLDVTDPTSVTNAVACVDPDWLIHLAGVTFVPASHNDPTLAVRTNVLGSVNVLAAVRARRPTCRVLFVGSADSYGLVDDADLPIRETCRFQPLSPYGASKAAADLIAYQWARSYDLDIVRVRPFNHTGRGQKVEFVCPDFARQLVAIKRGRRAPRVEVGNLEVVRDFSDVRDVVAAYVATLERGASGEAYNVCSGVGVSVRDVLETLIELSGLEVEVSVAKERVRGADVPRIVGCADKLRSATGWAPRYELRATLTDVLADWRERCDI
jgi:GDP-4-dehydro-6-deoxy-D-mannose reductase